MTRSLNTGLLGLVIALIAVAQIVTVGVVLNASAESRDRALAERMADAERLVVDAVNRRSEELAHAAQVLAHDEDLGPLLGTSAATRLEAVIQRFAGARDTDFALVVSGEGRLLAHSRSAALLVPSLTPELLTRIVDHGAGQPVAALLGRSPNQMYVAPVASSAARAWVVAGTPISDEFSDILRFVSGTTVTLYGGRAGERPALLASSQLADGMSAGEADLLESEVVLRTLPDQAVNIRLGLPVTDVARAHEELRLQVLVLAFGLVMVSGLIVMVLLNYWTRTRVFEPLQDVIAGVNRIRSGNYSKPVRSINRDQIGRLARAVNDMQKEVADREGRIVHHAQYDALTGLTNRSVVNDKLQSAVGRARRTGESCAALAIDLSRFNAINDTMGHEVGDLVLKEVARRLASNTSVSDTVARVGGDEFFVIIESIDETLAQHMGEFIASTLETPIVVKGTDVHLHAHVGMALFPTHCETPAALRRLANVALSAAKEDGKGVMLYEPGQDERHLRELAIVQDLPGAIQNGEFYIQYQPKIDMETQQVEHVEALVRWRHPHLGFIPPDEFIGLLEKANSISKLTDWVVKTVVKQGRLWQSKGFDLRIAVNLSAMDLLDTGLCNRISMLLQHYVLDPGKISVEVTESAVMKDPDLACRVLESLTEIGIKVGLDDFGTGQTSLALLKKLPLHELKIDKSFVQNLRADSGDAIIVKSTIDLGHNMGLVVTAEGVENNYAWNLLNSFGCDLVQGYLVSRPMSAEDLEEWYLRLQNRHLNKLDFSFLPTT